MKMEIDAVEFAAQLKVGKGIVGKDGALTSLIKHANTFSDKNYHNNQKYHSKRDIYTTQRTKKDFMGWKSMDKWILCQYRKTVYQ